MNNALFLFLILLLGLLLCSFLGGNCYQEGLTVESESMPKTGVSNTLYDNYNHFMGSSTNGAVYYGPNGGVAKIITNADGTQSLQVTLENTSSPVVFTPQPPSSTIPSPMSSSAAISTATIPTSTSSTSAQTTFYGPNGNTATIVNTPEGPVIQVNTNNGTMTFSTTMPTSASSTNSMSSTQYYGSTGTPVESGSYSLGYSQPTYNPAINTGSVTGNTAYYAQGPAGNTVVGTTADYSSSLPAGIPKNRIPSGEEDLYILKSQVVPPVCPACPVSSACPREKPCPACPACARCPEPSMTCKAVPNYGAANYNDGSNYDQGSPFGGGGSINNQYIPVPVLNNFSTFGS